MQRSVLARRSYCQAPQAHERCCTAGTATTALSILACRRCPHHLPRKPAATRPTRCKHLTSMHPREPYPPLALLPLSPGRTTNGTTHEITTHASPSAFLSSSAILDRTVSSAARSPEKQHIDISMSLLLSPALLSTALFFPSHRHFRRNRTSPYPSRLAFSRAAFDHLVAYLASHSTETQHVTIPFCFFFSAAFDRIIFASRRTFRRHRTLRYPILLHCFLALLSAALF